MIALIGLQVLFVFGCSDTRSSSVIVDAKADEDIDSQAVPFATSFFVEKASLSDIDSHEIARRGLITQNIAKSSDTKTLFVTGDKAIHEDFVIAGHRIIEGEGTVIAIRTFFIIPFWPNPVSDAETFEKVTILLPFSSFGDHGSVRVDDQDVVVYWSGGQSAFPRAGCLGYGTAGDIRYQRLSDSEVTVALNITFDAFTGIFGEECRRSDIEEELTLQRKSVGELTTWEGRPGSHIYEESLNGPLIFDLIMEHFRKVYGD